MLLFLVVAYEIVRRSGAKFKISNWIICRFSFFKEHRFWNLQIPTASVWHPEVTWIPIAESLDILKVEMYKKEIELHFHILFINNTFPG